MKRILVIDDDPSITSLLRRGLSYEGFQVSTAPSGEEGLRLARETPPDLVVLDLMLPGLDGLEVLRRLRSADPQLPVLMLTARDTAEDQIQAFGFGAEDYVVKPFRFEVLLARIQARLRQRQARSELRYADLRLNPESHQVFRGSREVVLTGLEFRLLHTFMRQPERVLSKSFLLDAVWGSDFFGDTNIVEVYIKQLRQKLGEPRLIQTLRGVGYVLREKSPGR
ncbi:response regulator transcription factor [Meiothermus rufus]|uniref:response regulator transcription factor n=1 Tax=Meiothermus rufus TaxID=604332 RepID=UPI00042505EB|nr:response regulator transcription factor [Meiothermus rufus]